MKNIKQEQLDAIIALLQKYNVGIQEYSQVLNMFDKLPKVEEDVKEDKKK